MTVKEAWVLQLKPEVANKEYEGKAMYLSHREPVDHLTDDLQRATRYKDKQTQIDWFKKHEKFMEEKYGENPICNFGWTNISKNFDFVEVEIAEVD